MYKLNNYCWAFSNFLTIYFSLFITNRECFIFRIQSQIAAVTNLALRIFNRIVRKMQKGKVEDRENVYRREDQVLHVESSYDFGTKQMDD